MHDFSLLIKKLKIGTSLRKNKNKSKLNSKGTQGAQKGTLVKGQGALYWLLTANKIMGEGAGITEVAALYLNS